MWKTIWISKEINTNTAAKNGYIFCTLSMSISHLLDDSRWTMAKKPKRRVEYWDWWTHTDLREGK